MGLRVLPKLKVKKYFTLPFILSVAIHLSCTVFLPLIFFDIDYTTVKSIELSFINTLEKPAIHQADKSPDTNRKNIVAVADGSIFEEVEILNEPETELPEPINCADTGEVLPMDSLLLENNSLELLKIYIRNLPSDIISENGIYPPQNTFSDENTGSKFDLDILKHWKMLRDKGLSVNNPIRTGNEPNRSGVPLGNWWGFYAELEIPKSDTLWGLSKINLDSLLQSIRVPDSIIIDK